MCVPSEVTNDGPLPYSAARDRAKKARKASECPSISSRRRSGRSIRCGSGISTGSSVLIPIVTEAGAAVSVLVFVLTGPS